MGRNRKILCVDGDRLDALSVKLRRRLVVVEQTRLARRSIILVTDRDHPDGRPLLLVRSTMR